MVAVSEAHRRVDTNCVRRELHWEASNLPVAVLERLAKALYSPTATATHLVSMAMDYR